MKRLYWFGASLVSAWLALCPLHPAAAQSPPEKPAGSQSEASPSPGDHGGPVDSPTYRVLEDRLTLREPFNKASGKTRIIAFLSPSCPHCQKNAADLQEEVLAKNPSKDLAVFIVWLKALKKDDESAVTTAMQKIPDPRVQHFWDPERVLNAQLLDAIMFDVQLRLYDIFLLYDGTAEWKKRLPRPGYWMHQYKGAPGPWWNVNTFAGEIEKGLRGEPFTSPIN